MTTSGSLNVSLRLGTVFALLDGWTGSDVLTMESGSDTVWGNSGSDTLTGGLGDDVLIGDWDAPDRIGNDALYNGDGNAHCLARIIPDDQIIASLEMFPEQFVLGVGHEADQHGHER